MTLNGVIAFWADYVVEVVEDTPILSAVEM